MHEKQVQIHNIKQNINYYALMLYNAPLFLNVKVYNVIHNINNGLILLRRSGGTNFLGLILS